MSQEVNTLKIKELTEAGETVGEIASELNCSKYIIRKYLKKMQITPTSKKTLITTEIIDNIIKLNTEGLTNKQIGIHLNISKSKFYNLVKPYIIPSMEYKFKNWNP